jgi:hypothetical protein
MAQADSAFLEVLAAMVLLTIAGAVFRFYATNGPGPVLVSSTTLDGQIGASLFEIPSATPSERNYRVCLTASWLDIASRWTCRVAAYLGGVPRGSGPAPVRLIWIRPAHLEIHYGAARSATLYRPYYMLPLMRIWVPGIFNRHPAVTISFVHDVAE